MKRECTRRLEHGHSAEANVDYSDGFVRTPDQKQRCAKLTRPFTGLPKNADRSTAAVDAMNSNFERIDHAANVFADQPDVRDIAKRCPGRDHRSQGNGRVPWLRLTTRDARERSPNSEERSQPAQVGS